MASIPDTYRTPHGLTDDLRRLLTQKRAEERCGPGHHQPGRFAPDDLLQFSLHDSDRMHLPTNRTTRKVKNILERPEVTAFVDLDPGWVSCTGRARIIEGAEAADLNRRCYERIMTEAGPATIGRFLEAHEDATTEITPTKWLSWQMKVIFAWFHEQGIDPGNPAEWLKDLTEQ